MNKGGYEIGYQNTDCFWGKKPGSLVLQLENIINDFDGLKILDLGCGEGKNSYFLGEKGAIVDAYELSEEAIKNGRKMFTKASNVNMFQRDVLTIDIKKKFYDVIICYGLFHCFRKILEVEKLIQDCLDGLTVGGFFVVCAFNSRRQDLSAHEGFYPLLLEHKDYLGFYKDHQILFESDTDLYETHPHNNIPHVHSMTRMIIKKR